MTAVNPEKFTLREHEIEIRVRYQETDAQGIVHHANYLSYFEIGRIEMLRAGGASYKALEDSGIMLVVSEAFLDYAMPAVYDDLLKLTTTLKKSKGARIRHEYKIERGSDLIVQGHTVVAALTHEGKVVRLPDWLQVG